MLTSQLRGLENDDIINRKVYPEVPPKAEYSLTERGKKLCLIFVAPLHEWGVDYIKDIKPDQAYLVNQKKSETS